MKKFMIIAAGLVIALSAAAQTTDAQTARKKDHHRKPLTIEQEAQMRVEKMTKELDLTDGQAKKLLKFYKKDIRYRREKFPAADKPEAGPEKGPRDSAVRPQHNGKPQGGPGPRPEGKPGVRPSPDHNGHGPGMNPGAPKEIDYEALDKYNEKQDKNLKKILGEEKYNLWTSKHPRKPSPSQLLQF